MLSSRSTSGNKGKIISRRIFILSVAKVIVFTGIVGRLFSLQISEGKKYKTLSDKNRLREWKTAPKRGVIRDYFGNVIAKNNPVFQLHLIPEDVENINLLFFRIKKIADLKDSQINYIKKKIKKQKPWESVIVSDNLKWSQFSKLNLYLHELPGVKPVISVARQYPENESFSHTLGYVSAASKEDLKNNKNLRDLNIPGLKVGKTGLEKSLDSKLTGKPGFQRYEVNVYGKRIKQIEMIEGEIGKSFRTTLDTEVQKHANNLLLEKSGSICVMDIYTGHIISMASSPTFDPNKFVHGISSSEWNSLVSNTNKPLINKSIAGLYPPGSTIKPLVALSALEFDVVNTRLKTKCSGSVELYGHKYHCWKEKGHGYVGLRDAIKQSCDIYFYELARKLGVDRLSVTAKKFGLGGKTLEEFSEEKKGLVPNTKWKLKNLGKRWLLGETLISGIGQGYYQTTPIQLCLMIAQLANGGYKIKPTIIDEKQKSKKDFLFFLKQKNKNDSLFDPNRLDQGPFANNNLDILVRNQENIKFILNALYGATNEWLGTSFKSKHTNKKYLYAGKTGTSQVTKITEEQRKLKIKNKDLPYLSRDHALFVGFAPYKKPRYAISVVIEHGGTGSSGAAPLAKQIIKTVIDRHELRELNRIKFVEEI